MARFGRRIRRMAGFTLVELLVVIAIVVILISLLMPALARAKEMALRTVCASNLHQLGVALFAYASEYHHYPPQRLAAGLEMTSTLAAGSYRTPQENSMPGSEFKALVRILGSTKWPLPATDPMPQGADILSCPEFTIPPPVTNIAATSAPFSRFPTQYSVLYRDTFWPNESGYYENSGGPAYKGPPQAQYYYAELGYCYLGGSYWWPGPSGGGEAGNIVDSPLGTSDNPNWGLAADIVSTISWSPSAHISPTGGNAGGNELYNDGHVDWINWDNGKNMLMNGGPFYQFWWRRTVDMP